MTQKEIKTRFSVYKTENGYQLHGKRGCETFKGLWSPIPYILTLKKDGKSFKHGVVKFKDVNQLFDYCKKYVDNFDYPFELNESCYDRDNKREEFIIHKYMTDKGFYSSGDTYTLSLPSKGLTLENKIVVNIAYKGKKIIEGVVDSKGIIKYGEWTETKYKDYKEFISIMNAKFIVERDNIIKQFDKLIN